MQYPRGAVGRSNVPAFDLPMPVLPDSAAHVERGEVMRGGEAGPQGLAKAFLGRKQILIPSELARRTRRRPNPLAEARAHQELVALLGRDPQAVLQRVADLAVALCRAGSAGVSVLARNDAEEPVLQWDAVAGEYSHYLGP